MAAPAQPPAGRLLPRSRAVVAALALIALVVVADLISGTTAVLIPLLVAGPLVAAVRAAPRQVAAVAVVAVLAGLGLGLRDHAFSHNADGVTALIAVLAGGVLAVAVARAQQLLAGTVRERGAELATERAARRRADLLARSGELLEALLDPDTVLRQVTGVPLPEFADVAIVDLRTEDGSLRGAVIQSGDPEVTEAVTQERRAHPLDANGQHPVALALRERRAQLLPRMTDADLRRIAGSPEHLKLMRRFRYRSAIALPLTARGRTTGALSFLRLDGSPPFDDADLQLGLDIARRAALAYDNARLFSDLRIAEGRLEAVVANLGEAVAVFGPDNTLLFANQAAADMAGVASPDDLMAGDPDGMIGSYEVTDERGDPAPLQRRPLGAALRGEHPEPMVVHAVARGSGRRRWFQMRAAPVLDRRGAIQLVVSVIEDVTAVKRQEARARLLANASKLLSSSLDVATTLDKAAWVAVPELADWARVDLVDDHGMLQVGAAAHRDLDKLELLHEWRRDFPPDVDGVRGPWEVLRAGRSIVWDHVDEDDIERYAQAPRHAEIMRTIGTRSLLLVPMKVGDRVIGVMEVATTRESSRMLEAADLELVEELATRAAVAVENARVHGARAHIAATLQRSLLPPTLPDVPGLTIASRFRAAGAGESGTEVGGDFYDLFEGRGRWVILMGDVTGKGPAAAAITSLARYTMRTAAMYEREPSAMLARLNATLASDPERRQICTAVCVSVDSAPAGEVRLEVVCAGHPPPLLIAADGSVRPVGRPGTLLGAFADGAWHPEKIVLAGGEVLVLYTDGVTDTRGEHDRFGSDRLAALLATMPPGCGADDVARRIDEELLAFGEQRDDVALLVLRAEDGHPTPCSAGVEGVLRGQTP